MASFSLLPPDAVTPEEKSFFRQLGTRIAQLRKEQSLTQQQLAEALDVTQQVVASYEIGRRRVPVSLLPTLARALAVSMEDLIGERDTVARKRGPAPKLAQHMERISQLPRAKQRFVIEMLDTVLAQAQR
jgi:transcriptional regulator with XRE-family HTH domain